MVEMIIKELKWRGKETYSIEEIIEVMEKYTDPKIVESGDIVVNMETREVICNGVKHTIPKKEFLLLHHLIKNKNKVLRREQLLNEIWEQDVVVIERTIDVHVRRIRNRFPSATINTIKGVGYVWKE